MLITNFRIRFPRMLGTPDPKHYRRLYDEIAIECFICIVFTILTSALEYFFLSLATEINFSLPRITVNREGGGGE